MGLVCAALSAGNAESNAASMLPLLLCGGGKGQAVLFWPRVKRLEILLLALVGSQKYHSLGGWWELGPLPDETHAPEYARGEIATRLKCLITMVSDQQSHRSNPQVCVSGRGLSSAPQYPSQLSHKHSCPHCTADGTESHGGGSKEAALLCFPAVVINYEISVSQGTTVSTPQCVKSL